LINLLVVEDSPIFAEALVLMLQGEERLSIVKVVGTAEKALQIIGDLDIDLVLVDISLPKMDGIELVRRLKQSHPEILCLILSGEDSGNMVMRSLKAGARGYVIKDRAANIREAICQVLSGEAYISKELKRFLPK
jgi:two-component system, NarL family, nitrate/nitrite response regulator NarL